MARQQIAWILRISYTSIYALPPARAPLSPSTQHDMNASPPWPTTGEWTPFPLRAPKMSTIPSASGCMSHHSVPRAVPCYAMRQGALVSLTAWPYSMNLEGDEPPVKYSTLLDRPDLRHIGSNTR